MKNRTRNATRTNATTPNASGGRRCALPPNPPPALEIRHMDGQEKARNTFEITRKHENEGK